MGMKPRSSISGYVIKDKAKYVSASGLETTTNIAKADFYEDEVELEQGEVLVPVKVTVEEIE